MSLRAKLIRAATEAAADAALQERGRILWILDDTLKTLQKQFDRKLMTAPEKSLADIKLKIAKGIAMELRLRISSGDGPPQPTQQKDGETE